MYLDEMKKDAKAAGVRRFLIIIYILLQFHGFEIPAKVHLSSHIFTVENDILTPTFKVKRDKAKSFFLSEIKDMYDGAKLQGEDN